MQSLKQKIYLAFFLVAVFFILPTGEVFAATSQCDYSKKYEDPKVIYIEATGADDQNTINSAIQQINGQSKISVFLKEGEYVLSGSIEMKEASMLEGDKEAIVKLMDHAGWKNNVPLITAPEGANRLEVKCFQIDGNYDNNTSQAADSCYRPLSWNSNFTDCEAKTKDRLVGRYYYDFVRWKGGDDYAVHDMYLHDGAGDGLRADNALRVKFYDNVVYKLGHDAVAYYNCEFAEVWRNKITIRTNYGVRVENTNNVSVHDNVIEGFDSWEAGSAGIAIIRDDNGKLPMNRVYVYYNTLHHTFGSGIYVVASGKYEPADTAVNINHNVLYETGLAYNVPWVGAIVTSGFYEVVVENNTIDHAYNYGVLAAVTANAVSGWGYKTILKNNIIVNTQHQRSSSGGDTADRGVGITNLAPETHMIIVSYNDVWYNVGGDIEGQSIYLGGEAIDRYSLGGTDNQTMTLSNNISENPKFVNELGHDYHLQEGSPCIDAGDPTSIFTKEPDPNGGRIDIGRYGNTVEAGAGKTGISQVISSRSGSDGLGSNSVTSVATSDGGSWSAASDVKIPEMPAYYNATDAMTETQMTTAVEAATAPEAAERANYFGPLGESVPSATEGCSVVEGSGGLIPCGRNTNSSGTSWDECKPCDLCGLVLMGQLSIEFMVEMAAIAANLTIIFAGFLYIFAVGEMSVIAKAKLMMKYTIIGFVVVFAAWAIVNSFLTILGYIDPMGGEWYTIC